MLITDKQAERQTGTFTQNPAAKNLIFGFRGLKMLYFRKNFLSQCLPLKKFFATINEKEKLKN